MGVPTRVPCRRCSARIDRTFTSCPNCGAADPLGPWHRRRQVGLTVAVVLSIVLLFLVASL